MGLNHFSFLIFFLLWLVALIRKTGLRRFIVAPAYAITIVFITVQFYAAMRRFAHRFRSTARNSADGINPDSPFLSLLLQTTRDRR